MEEFSLFIKMTLTYLQMTCRPSERRFDNLQKLARATDKAVGATMSPYERIISDYLLRPDHDPAMKKWLNEYRRVQTRGSAQRLSKSLMLILRRLVQEHHTPDLYFAVQEKAVAEDENAS